MQKTFDNKTIRQLTELCGESDGALVRGRYTPLGYRAHVWPRPGDTYQATYRAVQIARRSAAPGSDDAVPRGDLPVVLALREGEVRVLRLEFYVHFATLAVLLAAAAPDDDVAAADVAVGAPASAVPRLQRHFYCNAGVMMVFLTVYVL